jgi:hypothetical protein
MEVYLGATLKHGLRGICYGQSDVVSMSPTMLFCWQLMLYYILPATLLLLANLSKKIWDV